MGTVATGLVSMGIASFGIESKKLTSFSYTNKQEMIVVKIKKF